MFSKDTVVNRYIKMVHGVVESGWREASRLLNDVGYASTIQTSLKTHQCSVVIVGAGMAGLGAARELLAAGIHDILILEAQGRAGGRICSIPFESGHLELGAQWIHGEDNPLHHLAHKHNLLSDVTSCEGLGPYLQLNGTEICSSLVAQVSHKISFILEDCEKFADGIEKHPSSVGSFMRECFKKYLEKCKDSNEKDKILKWELFHWHRRFQEIDNACSDLDTLSAKDWGKYHFTGGKDYINLLNGFSSIVDVLVEGLPENVLHLNTPVKKILWRNTSSPMNLDEEFSRSCDLHNDEGKKLSLDKYPIVVLCEDGSSVMADHVIVTSSVGYLKQNHKTMFEPCLPASTICAIEALGYGVVDKVFLVYDEPWWDESTPAFQIVHPLLSAKGQNAKQDESWWLDYCTGFDVVSRHPAVLIGWVGGAGAIHMEQLDESEIAEHSTDVLRKCTGNEGIPLPTQVKRSQWFSNPYMKGGYSHTTTTNDKLGCGPKDLAKPIYCEIGESDKYPAILFAGEASHESHFSTTHGAFESGQLQARVIVNHRKERNFSQMANGSALT